MWRKFTSNIAVAINNDINLFVVAAIDICGKRRLYFSISGRCNVLLEHLIENNLSIISTTMKILRFGIISIFIYFGKWSHSFFKKNITFSYGDVMVMCRMNLADIIKSLSCIQLCCKMFISRAKCHRISRPNIKFVCCYRKKCHMDDFSDFDLFNAKKSRFELASLQIILFSTLELPTYDINVIWNSMKNWHISRIQKLNRWYLYIFLWKICSLGFQST